MTKEVLDTVGLLEDCTFRFSQWDPSNTKKYEGTPSQWAAAQNAMEKILNDLNVSYEIGVGEAAFYGPKLDIQYKNVFGKEDTIVTIQIDIYFTAVGIINIPTEEELVAAMEEMREKPLKSA